MQIRSLFSELQLTTRFWLIVAMMIVPFIMATLGGYYVYRNIQSALQDANEETFNELIPIKNLQIALLEMQMPANDYLIHAGKEEVINHKQLEARLNEAFLAVMSAPFLEEQLKQLHDVKHLAQEANTIAREIFATQNPINNPFAAKLMEDMDSKINLAKDILNDVADITKNEISDEYNKTEYFSATFNTASSIILIFALILAMLSLYLFRHHFFIPIQKLQLGAQKFSDGNLDYRIPKLNQDEIGLLGSTLNDMASSLNKSLHTEQEKSILLEVANTSLANESLQHQKTASKMKRFMQAIEETDDNILFTDDKGVIEYANPAICRATGYHFNELIGQNSSILKSGNHDTNFYESLWNTVLSGQSFRDIFINRKKDGTIFYEEKTISPVIDDNNLLHFVATGRDITEQMETHKKLNYLAHHDALTGLGNRIMLIDRLEHAMLHANRNQTLIAILFLDLDRFKNINDSMGHSAGDQLLKIIANRLTETARKGDIISRLGGDEFVVVAENIHHVEDIISLTERIIESISQNILINNTELYVTTSIGITLYPLDTEDCETLLKNADSAMYKAKESGRNNYAFFSHGMAELAHSRITLESYLRSCVKEKRFRLHYQPKVDLLTGNVTGLEALLRIKPTGDLSYTPDQFIPVLEETGLIHEVGQWIIETSCNFLSTLRESGYDNISIAINISPKQFGKKTLLDSISSGLNKYTISPSLLEIEITESLLIENIDLATSTLDEFNQIGIKVAIDDFGTGYSSLSYLKKLPIDTLKIDKSFVNDIEQDEEDKAIISAVISLGKILQMEVIAEGVETERQKQLLLELGCHTAQGYLYTPALEPHALLKWLSSYQFN